MASELDHYLNDVRENLRLDPQSEREILTELETHAEDRFQEMKDAGLSDEEAARTSVGLLGSARVVARQVYEAHSQGSWRQALLAAMPHLFFSLVFALKWWDTAWLPVLLGGIAVIAIYGWSHGRPSWLFPWLGYSLLPVVAAGILLLYLPTGWAWVTILLYVPAMLWLLCYITIRSIKKDWLYGALMLAPAPSLVGW
ncbi:MAG: permease prefix domain 1-containing protein, partial [Dehalococcoidales bacterium]